MAAGNVDELGSAGDVPTRLARRLGFGDAVMVGLGAMIGAGVFAVFAPAAAIAGTGLLAGLAIAAFVAACNAWSSARLAAVHPRSGGTYVYGREQLGNFWGFLAGWGFVVGKTASCAAMAITVGAYAWPGREKVVAVAAVVVIVAVNYRGVHKTALATRILVVLVLGSLTLVVFGSLAGGSVRADNLTDWSGSIGLREILESAGLLFFAFAGYARLATLGEEVVDPARTIPRAIPVALGITLVVYAVVAVSVLAALGPERLASATAPLDAAVRSGSFDVLSPAVRAGGTLAALGVLLSLVAGVGRTMFAMAEHGNMPRLLRAVHPRHRVPHRAEVTVGVVVTVVVLAGDVRGTIGFSSFAVLLYYAVTNASAWTLRADSRAFGRAVAACGLVGCVVLAFTLPTASVVAGSVVFVAGALWWVVRRSAVGH
jgi:APA family basic amino acid/polyamine antiporter